MPFFTFNIVQAMNLKKFILGSIGGSVVYFLLGWLFYGLLFPNIYPDNDEQNMVFVYLGCLTFCTLVSYIYVKWANIKSFQTGAMGGAVIGLIFGLSMNFFMYTSMTPNYSNMALDTLINAVMGAIAGGSIGWILGKL